MIYYEEEIACSDSMRRGKNLEKRAIISFYNRKLLEIIGSIEGIVH